VGRKGKATSVLFCFFNAWRPHRCIYMWALDVIGKKKSFFLLKHMCCISFLINKKVDGGGESWRFDPAAVQFEEDDNG